MSLQLALEGVSKATTTALPLDPASSSSNSTGLAGAIQGFASGFATNLTAVTLTMDNAAVDIGKAAVIFLVISGVLLWFSRVNKHLGKELLEGGILIGLFIEFAVPFLMSIHY